MAAKGDPVLSATLPALRLDLLRDRKGEESKRLFDACRVYGFFYLDLTSDPAICRIWEEMLVVAKEYFEQPLEVKMHDARGSDNTGYGAKGQEVGPQPATVDGYEFLKISRREYLNGGTELTTSIKTKSDFFFSFMATAHDTLLMLLGRLSDVMGLEGPERFSTYHEETIPTHTNLALLRYPKHQDAAVNSVGHNKHTDIGSLTLLLCQQWGLQILSPRAEKWAFVEPRVGHAVINVGDSLRFLSRGKLASVVHRVIPLGGKQHEDRYSIAYFLRINDNVSLKDANGKLWSAKEWHDAKFDASRSPDTMENGSQVLTGMMENDDVLIKTV
ncbi:Clavaminate synthase-like protein [Xylariaceae sp. FL1651]|nr:Clavaminate synthase-like protein [Xylariaceae sp. FL1651]